MQHGAGYKLHSSQSKVWCAQHSSQFIVGIFTRCRIHFRCNKTPLHDTSYTNMQFHYTLHSTSSPAYFVISRLSFKLDLLMPSFPTGPWHCLRAFLGGRAEGVYVCALVRVLSCCAMLLVLAGKFA